MSGSDSGSGYDNWEDIPTDPTPAAAAAAAPADSEPEWDSDDFVPPPVGTVSFASTPAPTTPAAPVVPVEPAAPEQLELMYTTVLTEDDMASLIMGFNLNRNRFTPPEIQQYIIDHTPQQQRGSGRNRRREPNAMPTKAERAEGRALEESSDLYEGCKDFIERQPMYNRLPTNSQQKKLFKAFYSYCYFDNHVSQNDAAGERRWTYMNDQIARLWLDFIRIRGSSRGSVLRV
jgi:hypothetical protein